MTKLQEALSGRSRWVKEAAVRLAKAGSIDGIDVEELIKLCLQEAADPNAVPDPDLSSVAIAEPTRERLHLHSIGDVKGINRLAPKKPLEFGDRPLAVVYGRNGSGKTGFVRILKNVCGARDPGPLKQDIGGGSGTRQSCRISYQLGATRKTLDWTPNDGPDKDLGAVDIFDTREGWVFVTNENEVTYEPRVLRFLTDIISICDQVRTRINTELESLPKVLPELPGSHHGTGVGGWYMALTDSTEEGEIEGKTSWVETDEARLAFLQSLKVGESAEDKSEALLRTAGNLKQLLDDLAAFQVSVSTEECRRLRALKGQATLLRQAADTAATSAFSEAPLNGVGTSVWVALWDHARSFSGEQAYPEEQFPYIGEDARCVLCQEPLSQDGKDRLVSFEDYVKGKAEGDARAAEEAYSSAIDQVGASLDPENIRTRMDAAGVEMSTDRDLLEKAVGVFASRVSWCSTDSEEAELEPLPDLSEWEKRAQSQVRTWTASATRPPTPKSVGPEDPRQDSEKAELLAKQWISGQTEAVKDEVTRLKKRVVLELARSSASTTGLSTKKGYLAQELITEAFAGRFRQEMEQLGAKSLGVELKKTRTAKGHTLHRLQYHGVEGPVLNDVLSEGEFRVVSLAACLADAAGNQVQGPFVFDDPISSLDQEFEEAVVHRLIGLSADRQVIVFTHRLSLLSLLEEAADKSGVKIELACLRAEHWGTGEPGGVPINAKKPASALKGLKNESIVQARRALEEHGSETYYPLAKAICSDFRILVERVIESNLLFDVVRRHRRSVQTQGRLNELPKITTGDCDYLDGLMTKYSRYEHSQSQETPVNPPDPDELVSDIDGLMDWITEYKTRK